LDFHLTDYSFANFISKFLQKREKDMNNLAMCYIKETDLVTREIAGETIVVPVRNNVGDLDSIYTLNELGTLIWQLIDGNNTVTQIVDGICIAYDVTPEEAEKDALEFLKSLEAGELIRLSDEC
jgi:hypothetical protein